MFFTFFAAEIVGGDLTLNVHEQIKWVSIVEISDYSFCPGDVEIVEKLRAGGSKEVISHV